MLADVNLLQKHENNNKLFYWLLLTIGILICALIAGAFYYSSVLEKNIENKQMTLQATELQRAKLQGDLTTSGYTDLQSLQKSVNTLQQHPIDSDVLITNFSRLLPADGYFQTFEYSGETVYMEVLLSDDLDASHYLHHLNEQNWITTVGLLSVSSGVEIRESPTYIAQYEIVIDQVLLRGKLGGDVK
ncbi:PilN domain-containing protein [Salirhabdus sp. Marseille-P4669]|uniref:PilN domain-containing protein n=1 Tax=Salirhabdus sp. Marseille-P4669 TaxID=2042310 RepID=UPI000C7ADB08|nr:hypothetical protein [Salirhabdus sp. Marseille-P4669]